MKKIISIIAFVIPFQISNAQTINCSNARYLDSIFTVTVTSNVIYGHNTNYDGSPKDLKLDIYEPTGDTEIKRPLIIFAPKGSFISEDKTELSMVQLCRHFAARGYVAVSIDYRVGLNYMAVLTNAEKEFSLAVLRAAHDYKAAIRYFRKDAATTNSYKIDTSIIVAGGSSAGAITALHVAYLDKLQEIPTSFDTTGLGGSEGFSGNQGYSSRPHFVVNLCGAIADTSWMEAGNIPVISMQGNLDTEVPYGTAMVSVMGLPIMVLDGSASIKKRADHVGIENPFYTFWGKAHIPYDQNAAGNYSMYMDTVKNFITPLLHDWICGVSSVYESESQLNEVIVFPNPATDFVSVEINNPEKNKVVMVEIINALGQKMVSYVIGQDNGYSKKIDVSGFNKGIYFVKTFTENSAIIQKLIIE